MTKFSFEGAGKMEPVFSKLPPKKPEAGSFWRTDGFPICVYCFINSKCIGKIERIGRRFRWSRYTKPVPAGSTAKKEPPIVESHYNPKANGARWALLQSHKQALETEGLTT